MAASLSYRECRLKHSSRSAFDRTTSQFNPERKRSSGPLKRLVCCAMFSGWTGGGLTPKFEARMEHFFTEHYHRFLFIYISLCMPDSSQVSLIKCELGNSWAKSPPGQIIDASQSSGPTACLSQWPPGPARAPSNERANGGPGVQQRKYLLSDPR